jgi:hypothetical protein
MFTDSDCMACFRKQVINVLGRSPIWKYGILEDIKLIYDVETYIGEEVAALRLPFAQGIPPGWFAELIELSPGEIVYSVGETTVYVRTKRDGAAVFEYPTMARVIDAWDRSREQRNEADQVSAILRALNLKEFKLPI